MIKRVSVSKSHIKGKKSFWKIIKGKDIHDAILSGLFIATSFGICSPKTICMSVIQKSATPKAIACIMAEGIIISHRPKKYPIHLAILGSPTQPRSRLATVIPSCIPERYVSRWKSIFLVYVAHFLPCFISSSSCESRIFTRENSLATKNALSATRTRVILTPSTIQRLGSGVIFPYYTEFLYCAIFAVLVVVVADVSDVLLNSGCRICPPRYQT